MILRAFLLVLVAATVSGVAQAQQYRWVDKNGKTQFGDSPPPPGAKDVRKSNITSSKPAPTQLPFELVRLQKDFPVTLYTSPPCKEGCELARGALNKRGVPFKEVQVFDPDTNEELKRVSGALEVPTLVVGRSVQRGFEQGAFDALLDSAGYPKTGIMPALTQAAPGAPEGYVPAGGREALPATDSAKSAAQSKPGPYDSSGLSGPPPKAGKYGLPAETK